jgi:hypothetical protein
MILENKGVLDNILLKMVAKVLKDSPRTKGFKIKTLDGVVTITHEELIQFVEKLAEEIAKGNYDKLSKCSTCGNFSYPGRKGGRGWCSPKNFTSFRKKDDYCSQWIPMTEEQKYVRRKLDEQFGQLQTKRAGNGSKNSRKGN